MAIASMDEAVLRMPGYPIKCAASAAYAGNDTLSKTEFPFAATG